MSEVKLTCAALPLNGENTAYALIMGSSEGMRSLMGSHTEHLKKRVGESEWAVKSEVCCLIGDEGMQVLAAVDDENAPLTLAGKAVKLLELRYRAGLPGLVLLPCAPIEHNGEHLKEAVIACAVQWKKDPAFLRWLLSENVFCSTLTDCAAWLIEADEAARARLPFPEGEDTLQFVNDLAPYRTRKKWMLGGASVLVTACTALCGLKNVGEAMQDESIRLLLANVLTREILPVLSLAREESLRYAARVCSYLENVCGQDAWPQAGEQLSARFVASVLPSIAAYEKQEAVLPNGLVSVLSAIIMLYAGVRKNAEGEYVMPGIEGEEKVLDSERVLSAFERFSCDMPPETLAYAAISDREIWGCDLREIEGLEDKVTNQLRDMQILGAQAALKAAAQKQ